MRALHIRHQQFEQLGAAAYAARLHRFVVRYVRTPAPVAVEELATLLAALRPQTQEHGFDSEADLALFAIAHLCLLEKAESGELTKLLADPTLPTDEKRYRLSAELARREHMAFGALEMDLPET